ncbi:hypothetical protein ACFQJ7_09785 [Halovenus rubra]|uniref:Uncharacterized protein n=2 Tax=Halovenus rubra TaxID=869890 RepID=A0ABD5X5S8_9EURY|nr:hypothetical protein [Halovenus rubra]
MQRRDVLTALAAAGFLPTTGRVSGQEMDVSTDEYGSGCVSLPTHDSLWSAVDFGEVTADDSQLSVNGHWSDDEPAHVEVHISAGSASVTLNLSPNQAQNVARDLESAAVEAEQRGD